MICATLVFCNVLVYCQMQGCITILRRCLGRAMIDRRSDLLSLTASGILKLAEVVA
jgi:hypothetical protein